MKIFKDNAGRTWTVSITVYAVKRVRARLNVDLYGLVDEKFEGLSKLLGDPVALVDVLFVLCEEEAGKLGVSDEDFGRAMGGDAIGHAADAFTDELVDFFPDPRVRTGLKKVLTASRQVQDIIRDRMMEEIGTIDPGAVVESLKSSPGSVPGSSASTPDHSPSGSSGTWPGAVRVPSGNTRRRSTRSSST